MNASSRRGVHACNQLMFGQGAALECTLRNERKAQEPEEGKGLEKKTLESGEGKGLVRTRGPPSLKGPRILRIYIYVYIRTQH